MRKPPLFAALAKRVRSADLSSRLSEDETGRGRAVIPGGAPEGPRRLRNWHQASSGFVAEIEVKGPL